VFSEGEDVALCLHNRTLYCDRGKMHKWDGRVYWCQNIIDAKAQIRIVAIAKPMMTKT
jgi:hypothetical protein